MLSIVLVLIVAAIQGTLSGLMFWILGLPAPLLWGIVMGLLAVIPVLGAFIIWIPAALWLASQGHWGKALLLTACGGIVVAGIDNLKWMDAASVAAILGSPNIVTTDEQRREVWIYDKVSTDRVDRERSIGGTIIILGGRTSSGESSTTQRTLTIIIKFDEAKKVRDFAYNYSQF
mgnify:CR=1 FL=1